MNFPQLEAFRAIVLEGSFSRAAEKLGLTQPTISAQIQSLERSVGVRLIDRSAQGVSLTQAGQVFLPYANQLLSTAIQAQDALQGLIGMTHGHLDLAASSVPGQYLLPPALSEFKERYPGIRVTLTASNSHEVRRLLRDGHTELGFVGDCLRDDRLIHETITRDELVVVMRPGHPLCGRKSISVTELLAHPLVLRERGSATRSTLERALTEAGGSIENASVHLELGGSEAVRLALRAADVLAVVSNWAVRDDVERGWLCRTRLEGIDLTREIFVVRRVHGDLSIAGKSFLEFVRTVFLARYSQTPAGRPGG